MKGRRYSISVDMNKKGEASRIIEKHLSEIIVGQPRAIEHITRITASLASGLRDPLRPAGAMIFAGPSGCGKTYTAKVLAQAMVGPSEDFFYPLTIIQCSNLAEEHRISSLIGSPPGYVDSHKLPLLHRFNIGKHDLLFWLEQDINSCKDEKAKKEKIEALNQIKICLKSLQVGKAWVSYKKERVNSYTFLNTIFDRITPFSVILFDEIEKAHPNVWNLLLGILEDGQLQMANNNEVTSFTESLIILTTNTGSREIHKSLGISKMGFKTPQKEDPAKTEKAIYNEAKRALERLFPPELMGRFGKEIVVFRDLGKEDYGRIFGQLIDELRIRLSSQRISIKYASAFKDFVVEEGFNQTYGARILRDIVKKRVETPLSFALASKEVQAGDRVLFALEGGRPVLKRQPRDNRKIKIENKNLEEKRRFRIGDNGH